MSDKFRQLGLGLLEVMLTLVIAAVILILSVNYYGNVRNQQKINMTLSQMQNIAAGVNKYIAETSVNINGAITEFNNKDVADQLVKDNIITQDDINNVWNSGTEYGVVVTLANSGALWQGCTTIQFTIPSGLPYAQCEDLNKHVRSIFTVNSPNCGSQTAAGARIFTYCANNMTNS
jgi:Tfp pilus assembly protein PilE